MQRDKMGAVFEQLLFIDLGDSLFVSDKESCSSDELSLVGKTSPAECIFFKTIWGQLLPLRYHPLQGPVQGLSMSGLLQETTCIREAYFL